MRSVCSVLIDTFCLRTRYSGIYLYISDISYNISESSFISRTYIRLLEQSHRTISHVIAELSGYRILPRWVLMALYLKG